MAALAITHEICYLTRPIQRVHGISFVFGVVDRIKMSFLRRRDIGQAFRSNRQLQPFLLRDVTPTGRKLGSGSFGSVEEVK